MLRKKLGFIYDQQCVHLRHVQLLIVGKTYYAFHIFTNKSNKLKHFVSHKMFYCELSYSIEIETYPFNCNQLNFCFKLLRQPFSSSNCFRK